MYPSNKYHQVYDTSACTIHAIVLYVPSTYQLIIGIAKREKKEERTTTKSLLQFRDNAIDASISFIVLCNINLVFPTHPLSLHCLTMRDSATFITYLTIIFNAWLLIHFHGVSAFSFANTTTESSSYNANDFTLSRFLQRMKKNGLDNMELIDVIFCGCIIVLGMEFMDKVTKQIGRKFVHTFHYTSKSKTILCIFYLPNTSFQFCLILYSKLLSFRFSQTENNSSSWKTFG